MAIALNLSSDRRSTGGHLSASNDRDELCAREGDRERPARLGGVPIYLAAQRENAMCHARVAQFAADVTQVQYIPKGQ